MKRHALLTTALFLGTFASAATTGQSSAKPDFSGVWTLNLQTSRLQIPAPDSGVFRIDHKDPNLHLSRTLVSNGKEDVWTIDLITDGREFVQQEKNETFRGSLSWQGNDLFLDSTDTIGGRTATNKVTYHLSADGKTLTATEIFRGPRLKYNNVWVFNKGE